MIVARDSKMKRNIENREKQREKGRQTGRQTKTEIDR